MDPFGGDRRRERDRYPGSTPHKDKEKSDEFLHHELSYSWFVYLLLYKVHLLDNLLILGGCSTFEGHIPLQALSHYVQQKFSLVPVILHCAFDL